MQARKITNLLVIGILLIFCQAALAQSSGNLSGVVADANGAVIPGATIVIKNKDTGLSRTIISNQDGRWNAPVLPVGQYSVSFEKEGFKRAINTSVEVEAAVTRTADVVLEVGVSEIYVDVVADQPLVQAESAAVSRQITGEQLTRTPTSTRSFTGLLGSESGVSSELSQVGVA